MHRACQNKNIKDPESEDDTRTDSLPELEIILVEEAIRNEIKVKYCHASCRERTRVEG